MINEKSIHAVDQSTFSHSFRKPLYDSYCFSNIPGTIEKLLTGSSELPTLPKDTLDGQSEEYDKVVLFFIDAFGWRFFQQYKDTYPALKRFVEAGTVSKITSQFPSTTAAHVTTIHTGQRVDQSGVFEWFYYEPTLDKMIAPLLFSYAGDHTRDTLKEDNVQATTLYPNQTFYQLLASKGVTSHIFQSEAFTPSSYGDVVTAGVTHTYPFPDVSVGLRELSTALISEHNKAYFYFYFGNIDSAGHRHGPDSPEFAAEVNSFFTQLEQLFIDTSMGRCGKTLMLMTADHGQTNINPATTIYLNRVVPEITTWIKTNQQGNLLVPGGSCRDLFLYIKNEHLNTALQTLTNVLEGTAEVYLVETLLADGFFGTSPSNTLKARLGNLCILPYAQQSVFWWEEGKFEQEFYGHHGGLTPDEMESIFLTLEL